MALFKSDRVTSASGSVGGTTYSHNRYGMYLRARRVPVNPNTPRQQAARNAFSTATADWRVQTGSNRAGWDAYAAATPVTNKLGDTVFLPGNAQFVAINARSIQLGNGSVSLPPSSPGLAPIGVPTIVIDASAMTATVSGLSDEMSVDAFLGLFLGSPVSAGVSFFKGPYQLVSSGEVTADPHVFTVPLGRNSLPLVAGQRLPYRLAGIKTDSVKNSTVSEGIATVVA